MVSSLLILFIYNSMSNSNNNVVKNSNGGDSHSSSNSGVVVSSVSSSGVSGVVGTGSAIGGGSAITNGSSTSVVSSRGGSTGNGSSGSGGGSTGKIMVEIDVSLPVVEVYCKNKKINVVHRKMYRELDTTNNTVYDDVSKASIRVDGYGGGPINVIHDEGSVTIEYSKKGGDKVSDIYYEVDGPFFEFPMTEMVYGPSGIPFGLRGELYTDKEGRYIYVINGEVVDSIKPEIYPLPCCVKVLDSIRHGGDNKVYYYVEAEYGVNGDIKHFEMVDKFEAKKKHYTSWIMEYLENVVHK